MAEAVSQVCCHYTEDCCYDIDGNTACLCLLGLEPKFLDDSGDEELRDHSILASETTLEICIYDKVRVITHRS